MASPQQNIVVTVIPAGIVGGARRFSLHIAPRLSNAPTLAPFSDFHHWAKIALDTAGTVMLRSLGIAPTYNILAEVEARRISADPDPALWERLFPDPSAVAVDGFSTAAFGARFKNSTFHSYPTMAMHDFHTKFFTSLAVSNEANSPTPAALGSALGGLTKINIRDDIKRVQGVIDQALSKNGNSDWTRVLPHGSARPFGTSSEANLADHLQLVRFLQPRTDKEYLLDNPRNTAPRIDFHRVISMLADHPWLQRLLGLVMDYEISEEQVLAVGSFSGTSFLQCKPAVWTGVSGSQAFPRTRLESKTFRATVRSSSVVTAAGTAPLSSAYSKESGVGWSVISLDVEGTASKAIAMADTVQRNLASTADAANKAKNIDVPAPRSGGLSLVRSGRAADVVTSFKRSAELLAGTAAGASTPTPSAPVGPLAPPASTGDGVELYADDLIRGWRVDVFDTTTNRWRSLTQRDTNYRFSVSGTPEELEVADSKVMGSAAGEPRLFLNEGIVSLGVTASADPSKTADDTFVQEAVLEWTGWSLVAPRPGRTLSASTNDPTDQEKPYNKDLDLEITVKPTPSTLPRLRYGHRYRFRLRSCNLAGNGPSLQDAGPAPTDGSPTREAHYGRFEPVPPPVLVQTEPLDTGEALRTLVIKSIDETTPLAAAGTSERHVLPPGASAHTVELHGLLDVMTPSQAYGLVSDREGLQLTPGAPEWMLPGFGYSPYATPVVDPGSGDADVAGAALTYYVPGTLSQPPWLVDPSAVGLRLIGPEMGTKAVVYKKGTLGWPDVLTSRIIFRGLGVNVPSKLSVLIPPSSADWKTPRFQIEVAKGEQFTVKMSSLVPSSLVEHFGVVRLMRDRLPIIPGLPARIARVRNGYNRVVTPPTYLTIVHAVRRPLVEPRVITGTPVAQRQVGDTFALFGGRVACHPQSTSRLDFNLSWTEWVDRPGDYVPDLSTVDPEDTTDKPRTVSGEGQTQPFNVAYPAPGVRPTVIPVSGLRHDFGDTKHRYVRISLTGTSRYASYFREEDDLVAAARPTNNVFGSGPIQPLSERIVEKESGAVLTRDRDYTVDDENHQFVLTSDASSRYATHTLHISWVPATVTRDTEAINARWVHVKSSARPAAPVVKDVFPLFVDSDWAKVGKAPFSVGYSHTRNGQALRVYLDRPWYSSGDNEMLAVVLHRVPGARNGYMGGVAPPTMLKPEPGGHKGNIPKSLPQQYTTAWGRDPLVVGQPAPAKITAANFPLAAAAPIFGTWATGLSLPDATTPVAIVPHNVQYDETQKLWFADIQVNLGSAYRPFVRLALARFQPYSLDGCHLSSVALLDSAQLSPTRTLQVFGSGTTRTVTLSGPIYAAALTGVPKPGSITPAPVAEIRFGPLIQVTVQERDPEYATADDSENIGWADISDVGTGVRRYTLAPAAGNEPNGQGKYRATGVNVAPTVAGREVRLVVREFERDSRLASELLFSSEEVYRKRLAWVDSYVVTRASRTV